MKLRPCVRCRLRSDCAIKAAKIKAVRGLGFTLVSFRCLAKTASVRPGMIVDAKLQYVWDRSFDYENIAIVEPGILRGTVMKWKHDKLWVYFPTQDAGALWSFTRGCEVHMAAVFPDCLTPTGETERVCLHCGLPESAEGATEWTCRHSIDGYGESLDCEYAALAAMGGLELPA